MPGAVLQDARVRKTTMDVQRGKSSLFGLMISYIRMPNRVQVWAGLQNCVTSPSYEELMFCVAVGTHAGLMGTLAGMPGPPLIVMFQILNVEKVHH